MPASSAGVLRREQAEAVPHVSFELLTNAEMMRADQRTIADGTDGYTLMKRAGLAVAEAAAELAEEGLILVIAGRGNNGGDGFVAATELVRRGRDVAVMLLCQRDTLKGDAALAARDWPGEVLPCDPAALGEAALIIDALFGAGLDRPVKGDPRELIEAMNASGVPILSVDLPSGINGSSGQVLGVAVNATEIRHVFPEEAGASAAARPRALRPRARRRHRHRRRGARRDRRRHLREPAGVLARGISAAAPRRPQIFARSRAYRLRRSRHDGSGAAVGTRRAAGRRRPRDGGDAARGAERECGGADGGDGAACRIRRSSSPNCCRTTATTPA